MCKFIDGARDQAFLLPPDLRDRVAEDDLADVMIGRSIGSGRSVRVNDCGTGSAQA